MAGQFGGVGGGASAPVGPGTLNINGATNPLFQLAQLGARYNVGPVSANVQYQPQGGVGGGMTYARGPVEIGGGYDPQRGPYGEVAFRQAFQEGGLATSLPGQFETYQRDMDFVRDRRNQMHEVAGKHHMARGGFAVK
jgi:hypothetical protein